MTTSIVYNSYTLPRLDGHYSYTTNGKEFSFTQPFIVSSNTGDADFNTKCLAAENALNVANGALLVTWVDQVKYDLDPADYTGMLTRGTCRKVGEAKRDAKRSCLYVLEVTGLLPSSAFGYSGGGFEVGVQMRMDVSRLPTFVFTGEYRGEDGVGNAIVAYTHAATGARKLAEVWLQTNAATITGSAVYAGDTPLTNYDLVSEEVPSEDQLLKITYTLTYRFRAIATTAGAEPSALFTVESCIVSRTREKRIGRVVTEGAASASPFAGQRTSTPGGGGGGVDDVPYAYIVMFEVAADLTQAIFKDGGRTTMEDMYDTVIKPFLWQHVQDVWSGADSDPILLSESSPARTAANKMSVMWAIETANSRGLYSFAYAVSKRKDRRITHRKRADGQQHTYDAFAPGARWTAGQSAKGTCKAGVDPESLVPGLGGNWELLVSDISEDTYYRHDPNGAVVHMKDFTVMREYLYRKPGSGGNQSNDGGDDGGAGRGIAATAPPP